MQNPLLSLNHLSTKVNTPLGELLVVNDISFNVHAGESYVLLGESGSGKSMTALSIMRLLPPAASISGGQILLGEQNLRTLPELEMRRIRGNRIAMIFQEPMTALNPVMTVGRQIDEGIQLHRGFNRKQAKELSCELLNAMKIPDPVRRHGEYPHQLSGGMKQRVMIAMALACEPDLLIADEPTTALDVTTQAEILQLLKELLSSRQMGLMLVTHDLGVAAAMADRIGVMKDGSIVEENGRNAFFTSPSHPYSQALFQALPSRSKRGHGLSRGNTSATVLAAIDTKNQGRPAHAHAPNEPNKNLLEIKNLSVHFPIKSGLLNRQTGLVKAVDNISISLQPGKTLAVVGESGSGKTTLAKAVLQLLKPTAGSICFNGTDLGQLSARELRQQRRYFQIVFQDPFSSLNPRMRIGNAIKEGMQAQNIGGNETERNKRVAALLNQVGLTEDSAQRYPHEFSGGQRQRICIARALAVEPKLLICDEPTSALDLSVQAQIIDLLQDLQQRLGLAYLFITHNLAVVEYLADEVMVMYQGQIVESGKVDDVLTKPSHEYTRRLLAAVPNIPEPGVKD